MKHHLMIAAAAVALTATAALGADLPRAAAGRPLDALVAATSWAGPYLGINAGMAHAPGNEAITGGNALSGTIVAIGIVPGTLTTKSGGAVGGVQAGYNFQSGAVVYGVEADFDWSGINGSQTQTLTAAPVGFPASLSTTGSHKSEWLATVRGRLGTTLLDPATFAFLTAGAAFADEKTSASSTLSFPGATFQAATGTGSKVKAGWTVGAGIESMITDRWSWKAEYLYVGLGKETKSFATTIAKTPVSFNETLNLSEHVLRAGLNYRF